MASKIRHLSTLPFQAIHFSGDPNTAAETAAAAASCLQSCAHPLELARIHAAVLRRGLLLFSFHWNSLMRCYLRLSIPSAALRIFIHMTRSSVSPDHYSLPIALKAAFTSFAFSIGLQLHSVATKNGLARHEFTESGLISVYAKSGEFAPARQLFDENPHQKLGSWNALISSYAQAGRSPEAINLFIKLRRSGAFPDDMTMVSVVSACASVGDIRLAEQVHRCAIQAQCANSCRLDLMISNSLVDMYAKCGRTDIAFKIFDGMPVRDVSSWTSMIMGLTTQGNPVRALELFRRMEGDGVAPNHVTMVAVLSACSHAGLVEEGMSHFEAIVEGRVRGVEASTAHYGCVADMLGKVGRVGEAAEIVEGMPWPASAVVWGTLLGACEKHGEVRIGERAAAKLLELEPWNDGVYVVLSNIYAGAQMWPEVESVRRLMRQRKVGKVPGCDAVLHTNGFSPALVFEARLLLPQVFFQDVQNLNLVLHIKPPVSIFKGFASVELATIHASAPQRGVVCTADVATGNRLCVQLVGAVPGYALQIDPRGLIHLHLYVRVRSFCSAIEDFESANRPKLQFLDAYHLCNFSPELDT